MRRGMLRLIVLALLAFISACAWRQHPPEPTGMVAASGLPEPPDPTIRPLSQEIEEAAR